MEEIAIRGTVYISYIIDILAAFIIGLAVCKLAIRYVAGAGYGIFSLKKYPQRNNAGSAEEIRVSFGSSVAISLELLLGADVLATAVAPSWDDIGKLAAIALIRTVLNYFLERELKQIDVKVQ